MGHVMLGQEALFRSFFAIGDESGGIETDGHGYMRFGPLYHGPLGPRRIR
jgi:hypothetical protein